MTTEPASYVALTAPKLHAWTIPCLISTPRNQILLHSIRYFLLRSPREQTPFSTANHWTNSHSCVHCHRRQPARRLHRRLAIVRPRSRWHALLAAHADQSGERC